MSDTEAKTRGEKIDAILEEIGDVGVKVLVAKGRAVDEATDYGQLVSYLDRSLVESEIAELAPLGNGIDGILWMIEGWLEDMPDNGDVLTLRIETWTGRDFDDMEFVDG